MTFRRLIVTLGAMLGASLLIFSLQAQTSQEKSNPKQKPAKEKKQGNKKRQKAKGPQLPTVAPTRSINVTGIHEDFPAVALTVEGTPVAVYIGHDGERDTLQLATADGKTELVGVEKIAEPESGNLYQPCLTRLANGTLLCVWSELGLDKQWDLWSRAITADGKSFAGEAQQLSTDSGNDIFPDLGTDRHGRVWVTWQRLSGGVSNVWARHLDAESGEWSDETQVTNGEAGDWEPRLAFGAGEEALIVFDSYRNGNFDAFLAKVSPAGTVGEPITLAATDRYEARPEAAASRDGKSLWVAYETGMAHWGKDLGSEWRKKGGGLHHDREIKLVKVALESGEVEKIADVTALLPDLVPNPSSVGTGAIDVPEVVVDESGNPWVFFRFCLVQSPGFWQTAFAKLDAETLAWTKPEVLGNSSFCLDRRTSVVAKDGELIAIYPSDSRKNKQQGDTGVFLTSIETKAQRESIGELPFDLVKQAPSALKPYNDTPERARDDHHTWEIGGEKYTLYWGDVHRHTDFSNCRTTDDGCIVEHYRYAIEAGGLDFLGTSDHTDIGKTYDPYEWWQTQKIADLFHNPGSFVSLYAYEREQKFPYGHRNVVFQERGGPIIYIKRKKYEESPYAKSLPLPKPDGEILGDIAPWQVWDLLRAYGKRAVTIEHTPAGGMGTDWTKYEKIDSEFETILEVFQGSRNSSEGEGAPQPPIVVGGEQVSKFSGNSAKGTWQVALGLNHQLGAFASSDHRSTNLSYGGVYVKELTREGIFEAMDMRRTAAATDKIFMEFSCNGHLMGEIFETSEKPSFKMWIEGTAPISKVTLIRNEKDYQVFEPGTVKFEQAWTDQSPVAGENRYYLRIEQEDGNMGWTSPVWVTLK